MMTTSDVTTSAIGTYFMEARPIPDDRRRSVHAEDADSAAWRLEPGHYLDTPAGLVMATPELASLAISWSRG